MPGIERRRRLVQVAGAAVLVAIAATSTLWGPRLASRIPWLEIDRVEISGTRLLAPHQVLAASGITSGQHLLDDSRVWLDALRADPVIADAAVTRKPPNTVRIRVEEEVPVAYVLAGSLRLATADGRVLPVDPAVVPVDLPIVRGDLTDDADQQTVKRLLAETGRLAALDPALMAGVSEVRAVPDSNDVLLLVHSAGNIVLPFGASAERTAQIRAVIEDLGRDRPPGGTTEPSPRKRIDARFAGQIVVRSQFSRELS